MASETQRRWKGAQDPEGFRKTHWENTTVDEALEQLGTSADGLGGDEAAARRADWGLNLLPEEKQKGPLLRFLAQFHNALIYVLLGATVLTALMGHWLDTW